jgi:hypothetical protein
MARATVVSHRRRQDEIAEVEIPKPRIAAVGRDVAEVVRYAGGWLFDQAMAGWDVSVLTLDDDNAQSVAILGAHAHDLGEVLRSGVGVGSCLSAVAVLAELYRAEQGVRDIVRNALESGCDEVLLWGDDEPADAALSQEVRLLDARGPGERPRVRRVALTGSPAPTRHRLSIAARAFKAHALTAARVPDPDTLVGTAEIFRSVMLP